MSEIKNVSGREFEAEVLEAEVPVVVDFWAPWCGPCRILAPELEKLASRFGDEAKFVKMNVDENGEVAIQYGVMSIPTVAKFERGTVTAQVVGAREADGLAAELGLGV
ncbi:MAG: thioredoxin [Coriobacteriia bacterium]|nr:thioredoxin [Coriobacteriia bacterium]